MRYWLLSVYDWLWIRLCNPPRCKYCNMPMREYMKSGEDMCFLCDDAE